MVQQFQGQMKKRHSVLVFLKGATAPLVLYFENPFAVYEELTQVVKSPMPSRIIEKETIGPLKKVCINSSEVCAVALQEEQYM
ncbi:hypothetical protein IKQ26_08845 [bacterium]|nr:hypothetical protein [bacterium]